MGTFDVIGKNLNWGLVLTVALSQEYVVILLESSVFLPIDRRGFYR